MAALIVLTGGQEPPYVSRFRVAKHGSIDFLYTGLETHGYMRFIRLFLILFVMDEASTITYPMGRIAGGRMTIFQPLHILIPFSPFTPSFGVLPPAIISSSLVVLFGLDRFHAQSI